MAIDPLPFFALMARLACAGILIQTLEVLWKWRELPSDRLLGWSAPAQGGASVHRSLGRLHAFPVCGWLLAARAVLALAVVAGGYRTGAAGWVIGALVVLQLYYNRRFTMIAGNCETLFLVCLVAALAGVMPGAVPWLRGLALGFVAVHAALAYGVAGADKLRSRAWRDGSRLLQVMRDSSYRRPGAARCFAAHPGWTRGIAWGVLALELLFPLAILLPTPVFALFLAGGLCFHTVVAVTMGLHGFWWSFAASYPALWYTHAWLQTALR